MESTTMKLDFELFNESDPPGSPARAESHSVYRKCNAEMVAIVERHQLASNLALHDALVAASNTPTK